MQALTRMRVISAKPLRSELCTMKSLNLAALWLAFVLFLTAVGYGCRQRAAGCSVSRLSDVSCRLAGVRGRQQTFYGALFHDDVR